MFGFGLSIKKRSSKEKFPFVDTVESLELKNNIIDKLQDMSNKIQKVLEDKDNINSRKISYLHEELETMMDKLEDLNNDLENIEDEVQYENVAEFNI